MLVITGGLVHSVFAARGEPRDIVVEGDVIADIVAPGAVRNANAEVIDASRRLIIPGLINAHTHSHGGLSTVRLSPVDLFPPISPTFRGAHRVGSKRRNDLCPDRNRSDEKRKRGKNGRLFNESPEHRYLLLQSSRADL